MAGLSLGAGSGASLVAEKGARHPGFSSGGARTQLLQGVWMEPVSLALQGGLLTSGPPGKPLYISFKTWVSVRTSLAVQWLRLCPSKAGGARLILP